MLNKSQIKYLLSLVEDNIQDIIKGNRLGRRNSKITINYKEFKNNMELDDIRFHWLTGDNAYIAGGAALAWVVSENFNEDTDFFFTNMGSAESLENLIEGYGFVRSKDDHLTRTYKYEDGSIIQLVGINDRPRSGGYGTTIGGDLFGKPHDNIARFDFTVSQFATDCENVYTFKQSIVDVISKELYLVSGYSDIVRLNKYLEKGFAAVSGVDYIRSDYRLGDAVGSWY